MSMSTIASSSAGVGLTKSLACPTKWPQPWRKVAATGRLVLKAKATSAAAATGAEIAVVFIAAAAIAVDAAAPAAAAEVVAAADAEAAVVAAAAADAAAVDTAIVASPQPGPNLVPEWRERGQPASAANPQFSGSKFAPG
jgi:hypothetical protein